ncbi:MAG: NAD/NADP octopine/nopaline dehydrogenase family protein [Clostridia bacterium]|nr:NAD/NADP octopine/nopaline dehydrogenase family protein [Clostridia bacterium]
MKKIAVLGGGGTGCATAALMKLRGCSVSLYEQKEYWHEHIDAIKRRGFVRVEGHDLNGDAVIDEITDDLAGAIQDAGLILVCMVAWRHEELLKKLCPLLREGQTLLFSAGNFGSIRARRLLGDENGILVGEMQGNILSTRMVGDGEALIAFRFSSKKMAAFPGRDTERLLPAVEPYFACAPTTNVLQAALNSPNVVGHLPGCVLNARSIDINPDFAFYLDGLSDSVIRCMEAVVAERDAIFERLGYNGVSPVDLMRDIVQYDSFPELDDFRKLKGPDSMRHRYVREDGLYGLSILVDLGKALGVATPVTKAFLLIASTINGVDYEAEGLKLRDLGMDGLTAPDEINRYLSTGSKK